MSQKTRNTLIVVVAAVLLVFGGYLGLSQSQTNAIRGLLDTSGDAGISSVSSQPAEAPVDATKTPEGSPDVASMVPATVERVVDGDTVIFSVAGERTRVRLIGMDTPEDTKKKEPYGAEATAKTKAYLPTNERIWLEYDAGRLDRYGRTLAYVWLEKPDPALTTDQQLRKSCLNARLLIEGYARQMTVPPNVKYADLFKTYAAQARDASRGLWALSGRR